LTEAIGMCAAPFRQPRFAFLSAALAFGVVM
jgi:hypothetical protein